MDWSNDHETNTKKQFIPRLGRRAGHNAIPEEPKFDKDTDSPVLAIPSATSVRTAPVAPPRTRKTGWSDESKSNKSKPVNIFDQEKLHRDNNNESDDIPVIPDIEEIQDESISNISNAPSVGINRVTAYKELDSDLLKNATFALLDNVNLSILTEKLYPEKLIKETDDVWNWEYLFAQVSSELNNEEQKIIMEA
ncbi:Similar to ift43b: Intraflagellar transport protein 43 homolog B (Salmo salar) [Cotesia congregata]|uniref:Similar to ift43b: Intraflagellar transport protein 43 homolog B (Salmo salar) n=1 Tax=Cotesia congregata TaxID=51543 RepID=A0A8J2HQ24_COTCN|nr:Similar to ift43b: Intraflagellar transport protein 43 homolog B (Salmo salar) [Cotesia congregata]